MPSGRRVFAAFIRIGSPPGLVISDGGGIGEEGEDAGNVDGASISPLAAAGCMGGERAEHTKGSVLIEGGGIAY